MNFEVDNQTLKDLEIFRTSSKSTCIYDRLNFSKSAGGKLRLEKMFKGPLTDANKIRERAETIKYLSTQDTIALDIDKNDLDFIEHYLKNGNRPIKIPSKISIIEKSIMSKLVGQSNDQYIIERGVDYTILIINNLFNFFSAIDDTNCSKYLQQLKVRLSVLSNSVDYKDIVNKSSLQKLTAYEVAKLDHMLRHTHNLDTRFFLDSMYELDALIGVSIAMKHSNLTIPKVVENEDVLDIKGLHHLSIEKPVVNNIRFSTDHNMTFISGPNMAGKSTLLKSIGIAVYLAHCGFPVPAQSMTFSPCAGIYTGINMPDNLNLGESHFFVEVKRLKHVAKRLKEKKKMLIIFDELFRGTNVKDAYDGSLAVIKAFAKIRKSFFAISTHIVEVTRELILINNIQFKYLEVNNVDGAYSYSYKLCDGVSEDRLGMYIIEKEKLIELIESCSE